MDKEGKMNKKSQARLIYGFIFGVILISVFSLYFIRAESFNENNTKSDLIFGENISKYGKIEIKDQLNDIITSLELKKNTDTCGVSCSMETEIIMYQDGVLIDNIRFMELQDDKSWIDKPIKSYQFYIKTGEKERLVDDYETKCSVVGKLLNGTDIIECSQVKSGNHTEYENIYEEYELGTEVNAGNYYIKLEGTKKLSQTIDWQITSQGKLIDDWALWQNPEIAHFTFEEGSGAEAHSLVAPYYVNMTTGGGTVGWATGYKSNYSFQSSAGWFEMVSGSASELLMKDNIRTLCVWVRKPDEVGRIDIVHNEWFYQLIAFSDNIPRLSVYNVTVNWNFDGVPIATDSWQHICWVKYAGSNYTLYQNGSYTGSMNDVSNPAEQANQPFEFGFNCLSSDCHNVSYDELEVWNSSLTAQDIYDLYIEKVASVVTTTLNSPVDYYNSSSNLITFNCSANTTSPSGETLTNITLWLNTTGTWLLNETKDVSGTYNNSIFTKNIPDGRNWGWTCQAYDNSSASSWAINRTFSVNTPPTQNNPLLKTLTGKNLSTENLTCENRSTYDVDNDKVINIYNWYKNNQPLTVLNMPFEVNANDYSGYDNDGTIYGAMSTNGKAGRALSFDGVDDYVTTVDINKAEGTNALTTEAWIIPRARASGVTNPMIIAKYYAWNLHINYNNNGFVFSFNDGGGWATDSVTYSAQLTQNTWYYVVGRYDGSTCKIFVNGNEVASASCNGNITTNTNAVKIGQWNNNEWFNGSIDEVKIYPYALTQEQIKQRYEETKDGLTTNSTIVSQETAGGDVYMCQVTPNDGEEDGVTLNSTSLSVLWAIMFNVTDSFSGVSLDNVVINCDYPSFSQGEDTTNTYGPYGFFPGIYTCTFEVFEHFDKTVIFNADNDKVVDVRMSEEGQLTIEEHTWLEAIYECIINKDCDLYNLLLEINSTVGNIWEHTKPTDKSVIIFENITNKVVDSSHNLTIDYMVNIPVKAGYSLGTYLPVRIGYWFLDENNETCYNQGSKPIGVEDPYCQPLVIETFGPMGGSINFTVKLHPSLPTGNYNIKQIIDIDPNNIWINYGQEVIGSFVMAESLSNYGIDLEKTGETMPKSESNIPSSSGNEGSGGTTTIIKEREIIKLIPEDETRDDRAEEDDVLRLSDKTKITGGVIGAQLLSGGQITFILVVLCGTFIIFIIVRYKTSIKIKKNLK